MPFGVRTLLCTNILVMIDQLPVDRPPGLGFGSQACVLKLCLNTTLVLVYTGSRGVPNNLVEVYRPRAMYDGPGAPIPDILPWDTAVAPAVRAGARLPGAPGPRTQVLLLDGRHYRTTVPAGSAGPAPGGGRAAPTIRAAPPRQDTPAAAPACRRNTRSGGVYGGTG